MRREIQKFLEGIQARRESLDTWKSRRSNLAEFERWCSGREVRTVRQVTRELVQEFMLELGKKALKPATLANKAQTLRSFARWLHSYGYTTKLIQVDVPKVTVDLPRALTVAQIEKLLEACRDGTHLGVRDECLMEFLFSTGSRVSGVWHLSLSDLDFQQRTARILGKFRRYYLAMLTERCSALLQRYIASHRFRGRAPDDERAVFVSQRGRRMGRDAIWEVLQKRAKLAGMERCSAHQFRHALGRVMMERTGDLRLVADLLGHASVASTMRYTHLSRDHVRAQLDQHHPRAQPPP